MVRRVLAFSVASWLVIGCSSSDGGGGSTGGSASAICNHLVTECGDGSMSLSDCTTAFAAFVLPSGCADGLLKATCAELSATTSPLEDLCFPVCSSPSTYACGSDRLNECNSKGREYVIDCTAACAAAQKTYSGVCSDTYQGQTSSSGHATCWCK